MSRADTINPSAGFKESKLFRKLRHGAGKAIADFGLIEKGDRIAVAVSGGEGFLHTASVAGRVAQEGTGTV